MTSHTDEVKLYLDTLKRDLPLFKEILMEVSSDIIVEGYSKHPIFVATQVEVELGEEIINRDEAGTSWSIRASTLEELTERGIVLEEKQDDFKRVYKNPKTHCCIFLITPLGASFLYIPYAKTPEDSNEFSFNLN